MIGLVIEELQINCIIGKMGRNGALFLRIFTQRFNHEDTSQNCIINASLRKSMYLCRIIVLVVGSGID